MAGTNWGKLGLSLMGQAILSKSLIQFSVDEQGCVPSPLFGLRPNYGRDNGDLLHKDLCQHCCIQYPGPCSRPLSTDTSARDSWTLTGKSLVGSLILSPVSWCTQGFVCALKESVSPVLWKFCNQIPLASKVKFPWGSQSLCWIPRLGNLLWALESL